MPGIIIDEVNPDVAGVLSTGGGFETTTSQDKWQWNGTWFPASGWTIKLKSSGGVSAPDVTFDDYPFDTSTEVPTQQWPGSNIFTISRKRSGKTVAVGWLEAYVASGAAKLMWWSNGEELVNNRISCSSGDDLIFAPGSLPSSAQFPLQQPQISS